MAAKAGSSSGRSPQRRRRPIRSGGDAPQEEPMTALPTSFRKIRLELAREPGHPQGNPNDGYEFVAPLLLDGRIDAAAWREHREHCRVRRFQDDEAQRSGWLARKPGGQWFFDYQRGDDADDEAGFRFSEERFVPGEYASIRNEDEEMHTYRVVSVLPL
jgi:hypothetical protein